MFHTVEDALRFIPLAEQHKAKPFLIAAYDNKKSAFVYRFRKPLRIRDSEFLILWNAIEEAFMFYSKAEHETFGNLENLPQTQTFPEIEALHELQETMKSMSVI